jgi:hypothetical protein
MKTPTDADAARETEKKERLQQGRK